MTAKWVATGRAKIVHLDDNALGAGERGVIVVRVRLGSQCEAETASWTRTRTWANAKEVLRGSGVVSWIAIPATGCGCGIAVARAKGVAGTISKG